MPAAVCPLSRYDPLTSVATSTGPDLADSESMPPDVTPPRVHPTGCQIPKCPGTGPATGAVPSPSVPGRVHCWGLGTQSGPSTTPSHKGQWDSLSLQVGSLPPWASAPCCPSRPRGPEGAEGSTRMRPWGSRTHHPFTSARQPCSFPPGICLRSRSRLCIPPPSEALWTGH